ncbi:MAG: outer membrane beta-barrel domain-containing protein [Halobacteriovoraceae bacterium]|nr:outer membrane beta-barrel domain-containing protein [Halobacteriovoraceae bacterium]
MSKLFIILLFPISQLYAALDSVYDFGWLDQDKEVYVLQNRKFLKQKKIHVHVGGGLTTNGAFVDTTVLQGRLGYFATENYGFEMLYSKQSAKENETAALVRNNGGAGSTPFRRLVDNYFGAMFLWSPFYSKINTFNAILYYDVFLGVGYAKFKESNNGPQFRNDLFNESVSETHNSFLWQITLQFYVTELINLRLDLATNHFRADKASDTSVQIWDSNYDFTASMGIHF